MKNKLGPEYYNRAEHWDKIYKDEIRTNDLTRDCRDRFEEVYSQLRSCEKIIDVGSGLGFFSKRYPNKIITNCDQSREAINVTGGIRCDCYNIPVEDDYFDGVSSQELIEHLSNPDRFLKEMIRIGDRLCITTPLYKNGEVLGEHWLHSGEHYGEFTLKALSDLIGKYYKDIGHKIIDAEYGKCIVMWGNKK